jgi:hypothetical protein
MTTLNNPIESQNLIDRFADFVTTVVNGSATNDPADNIIWAADTKPFADFDGNLLTGNLADPITLSIGANNLGGSGAVINANTINRVLLGQLAIYTNVRKLRAILNVTGGGGNTGSYASPGVFSDQTGKAKMNNSYLQTFGSSYTLSGVTLTGTEGQFSCNSTYLFPTQAITVSGTLTGTATFIDPITTTSVYSDPTTFYVVATNNSTTFQLSLSRYGTPIASQLGSLNGLTFLTSYVVDKAGTQLGSLIGTTQLETFFTNLQTQYTTARDNTVTIQVDVCHASCHSSCHSNRGRR